MVGINANGQAGLEFDPGSAGSRLLALAVDGASGAGVRLGASNITLDANYIGLNLSGAAAGNHGDGVYVAAGRTRARSGRIRPANPVRSPT